MNPDLSNLAAYGGDYSQTLLKKLYFALTLEAAGISVWPGLKSKVTLHKLLVKKGLKPYSGTFKSKDGDVSFQPRALEVEKAQRDLSIEPSKYIGTFMEKNRGKGEGADNMTIPFAQTTWETVMEEVAHEIVTESIYWGAGIAAFAAFNGASTYAIGDLVKYTQDGELRYFRAIAATSAGQTPDTHPAKWEWAGARAVCKGFKAILDEAETSGELPASQIVSTGAITNTTAYAQYLSVYRKMPEQIKSKGGCVILSSINSHEALLDDYENKISKNFETIDGITYLAKTDKKCQVKPVDWLSGSGKLIATPGSNFWMGTDQTSDMNNMKIIEQMYHLDAGLTFMLGFQIADLDVIVTNDQD